MAVWPPTLQPRLLESGFGIKPRDNTIKTNMDIGVAKRRRRYTDAIDDINGSIHLDMGEYSTFMNFYNIEIASGTLPFEVIHPITQVAVQAMFMGPPNITAIGGRKFSVAMQWEILP